MKNLCFIQNNVLKVILTLYWVLRILALCYAYGVCIHGDSHSRMKKVVYEHFREGAGN